jgi:hypothetical protein
MRLSDPSDPAEIEAASIAQQIAQPSFSPAGLLSSVGMDLVTPAVGSVARDTYRPEVNFPPDRIRVFRIDSRDRRVKKWRIDGLDIGSAVIPQEVREKLEREIDFGGLREKTSYVDIFGFASRSQRPGEFGEKYALDRANAFKKYFEHQGITWARIHSLGEELGPSERSGPNEKAAHRGVIIEIMRGFLHSLSHLIKHLL